MNPDMSQPDPSHPNLGQLRDIHLPALISWWPPTPGWWILAALMLAIAIGLFVGYRRRQRDNWRRSALAELARLRQQHAAKPSAAHHIVSELSVLLRRVAISCFPRAEVAMLSGENWLAFLDRSMSKGATFQSESGRLLAVAPYLPHAAITPQALHALFALCESWISTLPARGHK